MIKKLTFLSMILIFLSSNYTYISANKVPTNHGFQKVLPTTIEDSQNSQKFSTTILNKFEKKKVPENNKLADGIVISAFFVASCVVIYFSVKQHLKTFRFIRENRALIEEVELYLSNTNNTNEN